MAQGSIKKLTSPGIVGMLYKELEETPPPWVEPISEFNPAPRDETETYAFAEESPLMKQWSGQRDVEQLSTQDVTVKSFEYEATLEIPRRWMRLQKVRDVQRRIQELGRDAAVRHWPRLMVPLLTSGHTVLADYPTYDGVAFFGNGHRATGGSNQDNDIGASAAAGAAGRPTVNEYINAVLAAIEQMIAFKDVKDEPTNEGANEFLIMAPTKHFAALHGMLKLAVVQGSGGAIENLVSNMDGFTIRGAIESRLDAAWGGSTSNFAIFRTDGGGGNALIRQEEEPTMVEAQAEGSPEEFNSSRYLYGVRNTRGVGYGRWEHAVRVVFS